jgi:UDP-N-acetylglucosamine 4,6-dehydratase/5-epimerase
MKILITGGTGTIGSSFIDKYPEHEYFNISRNEKLVTDLKRRNRNVKTFLGSVEDYNFVKSTFQKVKPDVVIHAAALKHVDLAEENPIQTVTVNVIGSLNIIRASSEERVPVTVAISTDKASAPENVYGYSKCLMERMFLDANTDETKFAVCRFANVANSNGSVIPYWKKLKSLDLPLKLTDPKMNRLIFSKDEAASLINKVIELCHAGSGGFIGSYKMKSVNMLELAKTLSSAIEIVGRRPGEKLDEDLVSVKEIPYTYVDGNFIQIRNEINEGTNKIESPYNSRTADKMTNREIRTLLSD